MSSDAPATCGECRTHAIHEYPDAYEHLVWSAPAQFPNAAGFQELATLGSRNMVFLRVLDTTPDEAVIAFGCAVPTALAGSHRPGLLKGSVLMQGCSPVELTSVGMAALADAERTIVIGDPSPPPYVAVRLGATHAVPLSGSTMSHDGSW